VCGEEVGFGRLVGGWNCWCGVGGCGCVVVERGLGADDELEAGGLESELELVLD